MVFCFFFVPLHRHMEQMQFTAVVLMTLLTLKLVLLPPKAMANFIVNRSRWVMVAGIVLLALQFLLQYIFKLRAMGVTQAVMLNLVLFIPASWMISVSLIYLQGWGNIKKLDKWIGGVIWVLAIIILAIAIIIDGQPLLSATSERHVAEVAASICFGFMMCYYAWRHWTNLRAIRRVLENYFDNDIDKMVQWMQLSIILLPIMALMVPVFIFADPFLLVIFGLMLIGGIFYMVDSFCSYVLSRGPAKMRAAEECSNISQEGAMVTDANGSSDVSANWGTLEGAALKRMEDAVAKWKDDGGHLKSGLTQPNAAKAMQVPRNLLSAWLKHKGRRYNDWLADLRIEEAKHMLKEHPEWSNEYVAEHCGFSDRSYFQKKFKEKTGLSPTEFLHTST